MSTFGSKPPPDFIFMVGSAFILIGACMAMLTSIFAAWKIISSLTEGP